MKSVVVKIGSSSLVDDKGKIDHKFLQRLASALKDLLKGKKYPLLVLSGAVAAGTLETKLTSYQARAARGQLIIASHLHQVGDKSGLKFSLFLISRQDILNRDRYEILKRTFHECKRAGVIPVINENDATAQDSRDFSDNDQVAIIVGMIAEAESIFLFTNVAGVFRSTPNKQTQKSTTPIARITNVNEELMRLHIGKKSFIGRGGMESKLRVARLANFVGITTYILDAKILEQVSGIINGKPYKGTVCLPWAKPITLTDRNRWLIASNTSSASIEIDEGAAKALKARKSLLAVGIKCVYGKFNAYDSVEVIDEKKQPVALGISVLSSAELNKVITASKRPFNVEVMHANYLILFPL